MKILIIRFSSIGDIVLTTPVVRCVKKQLGAEVHYLTKAPFRSILDNNPYVDEVYSLGDSLKTILMRLQDHSYDFVIDLHKNIRSMRVRAGLRAPSAGFHKANLAKWLMVNTKVDCLPKKHIVERYFDAVATLRVSYDGQGLDYFVATDADHTTQPPNVVFAIGGAHSTKRLPKNMIKEICANIDAPITIVGGVEDSTTGAEIDRELVHVTNQAGSCSLDESAARVKDAAVVITHDTGMMHIAAALQRPIISIWGNTIPGFGMYPFYPTGHQIRSARFEVSNLRCRPCSKIGFSDCPKGHFKCMNLQSTQGIAAHVMEIISASKV
ncbi:MAG: glycosyltransferase family 9 protein [Saprospiraceae bacterium]|nr:glycosyltransferase family 9 protein [Saprospiraceae bacterium]